MSEKISVKLHIDTTGAVASAEVLGAQNQILKAPVLNAVKQWRYRVSYQNNKAVAVDQVVNFNFGGDDAW
jgi:outer membrane biosynthesis protein TonB